MYLQVGVRTLDKMRALGEIEAVLMQAVLEPGEFLGWLERFAPQGFGMLAEPPTVLDHADPVAAWKKVSERP